MRVDLAQNTSKNEKLGAKVDEGRLATCQKDCGGARDRAGFHPL